MTSKDGLERKLGKIWQYSETGHLHGIEERVDLSRFMNGTTIKDLML